MPFPGGINIELACGVKQLSETIQLKDLSEKHSCQKFAVQRIMYMQMGAIAAIYVDSRLKGL